jgi:hypothetical protein
MRMLQKDADSTEKKVERQDEESIKGGQVGGNDQILLTILKDNVLGFISESKHSMSVI